MILYCIFMGGISGGNCPVKWFVSGLSHPLSGTSLIGTIMGGSRIVYKSGEKIGTCIFHKDTVTRKGKRYGLFICECGNTFEVIISAVKNGNTKSCGCLKIKSLIGRATTHGLSHHNLCKKWLVMKDRCHNHRNKGYKNYGGRGITVCDEWRNDFKAFYDHVTHLEHYDEPGMSLDRERNNEGYKPGNVRWTTRHIQSVNSRIKSNNTSGYTGVSYFKLKGRWSSRIAIHGDAIFLGYYDSPQQAVAVRNNYIIANNLTEYQIQYRTV